MSLTDEASELLDKIEEEMPDKLDHILEMASDIAVKGQSVADRMVVGYLRWCLRFPEKVGAKEYLPCHCDNGWFYQDDRAIPCQRCMPTTRLTEQRRELGRLAEIIPMVPKMD